VKEPDCVPLNFRDPSIKADSRVGAHYYSLKLDSGHQTQDNNSISTKKRGPEESQTSKRNAYRDMQATLNESTDEPGVVMHRKKPRCSNVTMYENENEENKTEESTPVSCNLNLKPEFHVWVASYIFVN
jgi:hypothetical protein